MSNAQEMFRQAFENQCAWLRFYADEIDKGRMKISREIDGKPEDITQKVLTDYRHRLSNLEIMLQACERFADRERLKTSIRDL